MRQFVIALTESQLNLLYENIEIGQVLRTAQRMCKSVHQDADTKMSTAALQCSGEMEKIIPLLETLYEQSRDAAGMPQYIKDGLDTRILLKIDGQWRHPMISQLDKIRVFLRFWDGRVVCERCALAFDLVAEQATAWYAGNVVPYSQNCHHCGDALVKGWAAQLFDRKE